MRRATRSEDDAALAPRRVVAALLAGFAALALVITAVGLSGIIAFAVAERGKEISIHAAPAHRALRIEPVRALRGG